MVAKEDGDARYRKGEHKKLIHFFIEFISYIITVECILIIKSDSFLQILNLFEVLVGLSNFVRRQTDLGEGKTLI